jgi:predicted dehydrogenase
VLNNTCIHFLDQILQHLPGKVTQAMGDLQQIASAGDVEDHVKAFLRTDAGATADIEISSAENVAMPLPKWVICGTCGTLTSPDGKTSTIRWFDPSQVPPLEVIDGPATDRKYGNEDKLPWQEKTGPVEHKSIGTFYDNVYAILRRGEPMVIPPESVRETMRVLSMIRKSSDIRRMTKSQAPNHKQSSITENQMTENAV